MFADEIRRAIEAASRITLPAVTALLWRAYGEGNITEAEAEALSGLIELRQVSARSGGNSRPPDPATSNDMRRISSDVPSLRATSSLSENPIVPSSCQNGPRTGVGSRPRTDASLERRRRWAASGRLPPALAAQFTLAEQAALALVAAETARRGDCRLTVEHMAATAGISRSTVKAAIREARRLGLITVEERRVTGFRNLSNIVRVVSPEWTAWLRLARRSPVPGSGLSLRRERKGGGVKSPTGTPTEISEQGKTRKPQGSQDRAARPISPSRDASRIAGA